MPIPSDSQPTRVVQPTLAAPATPSHLEPGITLADRYRIVNTLGKGGMGEVYRADDLSLGVSVALKFLPPSLALDPVRLDHFRAEVRLARQVSHPNVCRVYDFGQADGRVFLSMEYVDGEDLASLLRRIGRLPSDKAIQIARQLCFGLAAAHEQGIIHRDLKPANVMLDGRGQARIMDFGIAGLSTDLSSANPSNMAGTPGYMSPEQLSGGEITRRSDIYSLGVLLYELFTGRRAFSATALDELRRQQADSSQVTRPSTLVGDLDPAVERVIFQCLEHDPKDRPVSAMAVAAALPGGDPLAAALAAGETPSPELIAAAGASGGLPLRGVWLRLGIIVAMLAGVVLLTAPNTLISRVKPEKSPEVLADRASEIIRALGYADPVVDSASGLGLRSPYIVSVNRQTDTADKVAALANRPGAYEFWYRRSPEPLRSPSIDGRVQYVSPFPSTAGEIVLRLDTAGRLETLVAIPPRVRRTDPPETQDSAIVRLFEFAGLDTARFTSVQPTVRSFAPTESVRAWTGTVAENPELPVRVHVGSIEGRINTFSVTYQYPLLQSAAPSPVPAWKQWAGARMLEVVTYGMPAILILTLLASAYLAWRNLRTNRGDRTTAFRVAVAMFCVTGMALLCFGHAWPSARSLFFNGEGIGPAVYSAVQFWLFYIALEPYARRAYPHALVSWTRLTRGQVSDPLVGRQVLVGMVFGAASVFFTVVVMLLMRQVSGDATTISAFGRTQSYLGGTRSVAGSVFSSIANSILAGVGTMLPVVLGQLATRRRWVGYAVLVVILIAISGQGLLSNPVDALVGTLVALIPVFAIRPGGMLGVVVTHVTMYLALHLPIGFDWSHWLTSPVWIPAGALAAMLFFAGRAALGRTPARPALDVRPN
ncbi:MAG: serine/threonine protein kinase [Phycisphaeraceae bacterium]|nr:serine/threonine protein kinase [Phycisphaeraceae bacterium]